MMRSPSNGPDETGAALILALAFILVMSLVLLAIASTSANGLLNSSNLKSQRSLEYAADGATTVAVQAVRFSGNPYSANGNPPTDCLPGAASPPPSVTIGGVQIWVYCTQQGPLNRFSGITRDINFYACTVSTTCSAARAVLQAEIIFDDFATNNAYFCSYPGGPFSTCGTGMITSSWIVEKGNN